MPKLKVLIVLSDTAIAQNVSDELALCGINDISIAESTNQAVDQMVRRTFNIIVVDARVPVTLKRSAVLYGGIDFVRIVRMCEGGIGEALIVFLRSKIGEQNLFENRAEMLEAQEAGADVLMAQPFTAEKLNTEVLAHGTQDGPMVCTPSYSGPCRRVDTVGVEIDRRQHEKTNHTKDRAANFKAWMDRGRANIPTKLGIENYNLSFKPSDKEPALNAQRALKYRSKLVGGI